MAIIEKEEYVEEKEGLIIHSMLNHLSNMVEALLCVYKCVFICP